MNCAINSVTFFPVNPTGKFVSYYVTGAMLVGTYDNFTNGDPVEFLKNLNDHMPAAKENDLIFIEKTGHTYRKKHQEAADGILRQLQKWSAQ